MPNESLTEEERNYVAQLVEVEADEDAVMAAVPKLSPAALHEFCCLFNWDSGIRVLSLALDQPHCDRATALAIYWNSEPNTWAGRSEVKDRERDTFAVYQKAERRLITDDFIERDIEFNIREEIGGIDQYWISVAANPNIPAELKPPIVVTPPFDGSPCENALIGQTLDRIQPRAAGAIFSFSGGAIISHPSYREIYRNARDLGSDVSIDYANHPSLGSRVIAVKNPSPETIKIEFDAGLEITGDDVIIDLRRVR
ncbi:DUF4274 domain-containing protein [Stieleria sp. JC731]|uniref:DUF4274 domain-containing protein n=1 Tax=Stieleria sp. JC731 TaxID=2894195 RepID=UPI001E577B35|nr:DUF4274 domain-containing protein [Stieleria sp. JC731]MCC9603347.1 DUF4274 domain-containing protein [Stieleria sp. JC731]